MFFGKRKDKTTTLKVVVFWVVGRGSKKHDTAVACRSFSGMVGPVRDEAALCKKKQVE